MVSREELRKQHQTVLNELEEGDLVAFDHGAYDHWAVYLGDEEVIHLSTPDDIASKTRVNPSHLSSCSGVIFSKAVVRVDNFFKVAGNNKVRRNNDLDKKVNPLPREEIVQNALAKLGEVGYNLLTKNCEHFAKACRYGEPKSEQVSFWSTVGTGVVTVITVAVAVLAVLSRVLIKK